MQFYFKGRLLELAPKTKIALTYQANTIAEIKDRQGTISNKFKVPKTALNNDIVESADQLTSLTDIPYRKNQSRINHNGMDIIPNGFSILDDDDGGFYNFRVFSGNSTLKEDIKDKTLSELSTLYVYNHLYDLATIVSSRTNTDGFIYALVNFEYQTLPSITFVPAMNIFTHRMRPCFFNHTLIRTIFEEAGWTVKGNVFSNPEFLAELIPLAESSLKINADIALFSALKTSTQSIIKPIGVSTQPNLISFQDDSSGAPDAFDNGAIGASPGNYEPAWASYGRFILPFDGTFTFKSKLIIETLDTKPDRTIDLRFLGNLVPSYSVTVSQPVTGVNVYDIETTFQGVAGAQVNVDARLNGVSYLVDTINILLGSTFKCTKAIPDEGAVPEGLTLDVAYNMPAINQWEFVKEWMQRYCLIPQTDELTKTIKFFQFKDIVANIPKAKNISAKHVNVDKEKKEFHPSTYAQVNLLGYSNDADVVTPDLGKGSFSIDDETLDPEKELFTSLFSASETKTFYPELFPYIQITDNSTPRICKLKLIAAPGRTITYIDGDGNTSTISDNFPCTYFQMDVEPHNLGYSSQIIDHFQEFIYMLQHYKKVTCGINWDEVDLSELDFEIPYYLEKHQCYFYLNKIKDWLPLLTTQTELIRLL